jgi:hypothetical protein
MKKEEALRSLLLRYCRERRLDEMLDGKKMAADKIAGMATQLQVGWDRDTSVYEISLGSPDRYFRSTVASDVFLFYPRGDLEDGGAIDSEDPVFEKNRIGARNVFQQLMEAYERQGS